jgi:DNA polymerase I-like protein with 3'-5' exonuclease and polymerase domains
MTDTMAEFGQIEDENLAGPVRDAMQSMKRASQNYGLAVVYTRHFNKQNKGRGSSQFEADCDFYFTLKRPEGNHKDTVRHLHGEGRSRAVLKNLYIDLQDGGYVVLNNEHGDDIQFKAAVRAIKDIMPRTEENAKERQAIYDQLKPEGHSETTLKRALRWMVDQGIVHSKGRGVKGDPERFWLEPGNSGQTPEADPDPEHSKVTIDKGKNGFGPNLEGMGETIDPNTKTPVVDEASLSAVIAAIESSDIVALDIETMPPPDVDWRTEAEEIVSAWKSGLKRPPKEESETKRRKAALEKIYKNYAVDPETAHVRLISVATEDDTNEVVDATRVDVASLLDVIQHKTLITHNGSFDLGVLRERYDYVHKGRIRDTELLYLLHHYAEDGKNTEIADGKRRLPDPTKTKVTVDGEKVGMTALKALAKKYLGVSPDKSARSNDWSDPDLPAEMISYALKDTQILLPLHKKLQSRLEQLGMDRVVELEERALPAVIWMEGNRFPADKDVALDMAAKYEIEAKAALEKVHATLPQAEPDSGEAWSWTKKAHILSALKVLGVDLEALRTTEKSGEPSTSESALRTITAPEAAVSWIGAYLAYQSLIKRSRDFVSKYGDLIRDGGIRSSYTKTVATGRLSCRRPNMQQVPARQQSKEGMRVRDIFRPEEGRIFVIADFEQVELLLAATIAERVTGMTSEMLNVFRRGDDLHRETAAWVLGKDTQAVDDEQRTLAKAINFGNIYGANAEKLQESAQKYGVTITLSQAKKYRAAFFKKYPELKRWHQIVEEECRQGKRTATTPLGRLRKLPVWQSSGAVAATVAKNHPVQGAGADAIKFTMAHLFEDRHNCPGNPELNASVHDEVVLSVDDEHGKAAVLWVKGHMAAAEREAIGDSDSPIEVDVKRKKTWAK